jgi:hypothetical protein
MKRRPRRRPTGKTDLVGTAGPTISESTTDDDEMDHVGSSFDLTHCRADRRRVPDRGVADTLRGTGRRLLRRFPGRSGEGRTAQFTASPTSRIAGATQAAAMHAHLLSLYEGVTADHSHALDGEIFD